MAMFISHFKFSELFSEKNLCLLSFQIDFQNQVLKILLEMI